MCLHLVERQVHVELILIIPSVSCMYGRAEAEANAIRIKNAENAAAMAQETLASIRDRCPYYVQVSKGRGVGVEGILLSHFSDLHD